MDDDGGTGAVLSVRVVAETGSTNSDLLTAAASGAAEGSWLRAERQVAGRGRMGRAWIDGAGNLFASTLVRLRADDPPAPTLTLVAAVALYDAVDAVAPGLATIKWPNDLLIDRAKLSGILLERGPGDAVVVGIGVNVAHRPAVEDRTTTCLSDHGVAVTAAQLFDLLCGRFAMRLAEWRGVGLAAIRAAWLAAAHPVGTAVQIRLPDGRDLAGRFGGLEPSGALRLIDADGGCTIVHAGDVVA